MKSRFGISRQIGLRQKVPLRSKRRFRRSSRVMPMERECDILWPSVIRLAARQRCAFLDSDCFGRAEAHHLITKRSSFRWDLMNGLCLCRYHHEEAHGYRDAFDDVMASLYPPLWAWWRANRYVVRPQWRPDMEAIRAELKGWQILLQETML